MSPVNINTSRRAGYYKPYRLLTAILLLLALFSRSARAQEGGNIRFDRLTIDDGLSQSTVFAIWQDRYGFMWFGTQDGLNKYDGYTFTVYKNNPEDPATSADNFSDGLQSNEFNQGAYYKSERGELFITPPPWQTWWAYGLYILAAAAVVLGYVRYRTLAQARELEQQRKELAQERLVADQLRRLDRLKDEFLANTSHELRTPLNGIIGLAESLIDGATGDLPAETKANLSMIALSGRRLANLVNDVLDFSKLKHKTIELDLSHAFDLPDKHQFAVAVGDATGKGIPAAMLMASSAASLQAILPETLTPVALLAKLDQTIGLQAQLANQHCALCYAEISLATHGSGEAAVMRVANAGCITPLIRRADGSTEWVDAIGPPLGLALGTKFGYQAVTVNLAPGDLVILTSDGLVEATTKSGEFFGFDRFERVVANGPSSSPEAMLAHLRAEVSAFTGQVKARDDLTVVVLQV